VIQGFLRNSLDGPLDCRDFLALTLIPAYFRTGLSPGVRQLV